MQTRWVLVAFLLGGVAASADTAADARRALVKGAKFMRSISAGGGYLWRYSTDLKLMAGEGKGSKTMIWIQPPGTPSMGEAFLKAFEASGEKYLLDCALAVGDALAMSQLESGGWDYRFDFDAKERWYRQVDRGKLTITETTRRRNVTTFDDDNSQSALRFLMALGGHCRDANDARQRRVLHALSYGLQKLLAAQYPNGAWPQRYDGKAVDPQRFPVTKAKYPEKWSRKYEGLDYRSHYTFNDNSIRDCILTALEAHRRYGEGRPEFLAAVVRGADFLLLAQMPEPQPVWAQQYNAKMEPAWARKFEPASVTGGESVGVCRTLIDMYLELGEDKYLRAVEPAVKWFKKSKVGQGTWARFYELKTNKPLYFTKDYKLVYTDDDLPTHYGFKSSFGVASMIRHYEKVKAMGREKHLATLKRTPPTAKQRAARGKGMEKRVREIIAAQDKRGRWVTKGKLEMRGMTFKDRVETRVFIDNMRVLSDCLALLK
ncbi:MAG: hypothetical protein CMO74_02725 [Verrucomicrobiales bacterium]|nr:hypothetical protein [Verrucomicrobiales bacterium]|tara:strand:- start:3676 stop:5139 length:1464 start_codon:yes stop_codon:yes gene_type:complete